MNQNAEFFRKPGGEFHSNGNGVDKFNGSQGGQSTEPDQQYMPEGIGIHYSDNLALSRRRDDLTLAILFVAEISVSLFILAFA